MDVLNGIILHVQSKTPSRVIVQVSFERLMILSRLENSCFLKPRIYPSVKYVSFFPNFHLFIKFYRYFMKKGAEKVALDELMQVFAALKVTKLMNVCDVTMTHDFRRFQKLRLWSQFSWKNHFRIWARSLLFCDFNEDSLNSSKL